MATFVNERTRAGSRWLNETARRPVFYAITIAFGAFLLFALQEPLQFVIAAWLPGYDAPTHRVHHLMIGALLVLLVLGVLVQLYRPRERVGAFVLAAVIVGAITLASVIGEGIGAVGGLLIFILPVIVLGVLHPSFRSFRPRRASMDRWMMGVAIVGAAPLAVFAALQLNLHLTLADDHVLFEHYIMMAGGALTIAVGALLASFRPVGWRMLVYGIAALAIVVAAGSIVFPEPTQGTNFGLIGGALVIIWAIAFVAISEYGVRASPAMDD